MLCFRVIFRVKEDISITGGSVIAVLACSRFLQGEKDIVIVSQKRQRTNGVYFRTTEVEFNDPKNKSQEGSDSDEDD